MKGYEFIPELIRQAGVSHVFSMIAHTNAPWLAAGVKSGAFGLVKTRHEETSGNAANGFSRSSGAPGVFSVTRGPGFANSVNSLISAMKGHVPTLMIVAESPATIDRTSQTIDQRGIAKAAEVGFHHIAGPDALEEGFWSAIHDATWNGCPQVLSLADGILDAEMAAPIGRPAVVEEPDPEPTSISAAIDALAGSVRPLIIAGQGATNANCRQELEELADLCGARVANSLNANWFFAGFRHNLGICGTWAPAPAAECLVQSDVVIGFGASLNEKTMGEGTLFSAATVIQCEIDIEQPFHASNPDLGLLGDAKRVATLLIEEWKGRGLPPRSVVGETPSIQELQDYVLKVDLSHDASRGLDLRNVYKTMDAKLPPNRIIVTDSGSNLGTMPTLLGAQDSKSFLVGRSYGSIGLGLGIAIGAATANPDRPVVLFCGDGAFMMASHDLDAVRLAGLDLTIAIMNDEQYGSEIAAVEGRGLPNEVVRQTLPDIPKLAEVFGGHGDVITTDEELQRLELPLKGLHLIDFRIDPKVIGRAVFY